MTNPTDADRRLTQLMADRSEPPADNAFADRIVELAAHDLRVRRLKRRTVSQVAIESLALGAVLIAFVMLARIGPAPADFGDIIPLASPAMMGLIMLVLWGLVSGRGQSALSA